jgi:hypothetical protein
VNQLINLEINRDAQTLAQLVKAAQ